MNLKRTFTLLPFATVLLWLTGCSTTTKITYAPDYTSTYSNAKRVSLSLASVSDKRSMKPEAYYQNQANGDIGRFDRPITDILREAVTLELQKAGFTLREQATSDVVLDCEILDLEARMKEPYWGSPILDLAVSVRFAWTDTKAKNMLFTNERSEHRTRKLGFGNTVRLPFDSSTVQEYGNEMINDMLPRIIEKELQLVSFPQAKP